MQLRDLAAAISVASPADAEISSLAFDDRLVVPGTLFFCVPGFTRDGHDFAATAVEKGASALVVERPLGVGVPELQVDSVRVAMAPLSAAFHGDPTADVRVVGITGTNGKTTSAFLIRELLEAGGVPTALLGTVKSVIGGAEAVLARTTPEAIELQSAFDQMRSAGDRACVMEASSHALQLHRVDAIHWAAVLFTNLTQDHLDFHPTMEDYFLAKRLLFAASGEHGVRVANVDDQYGERLASEFPGTVTIGIENEAADLRATNLQGTLTGSTFSVDGLDVVTPLPGRFNVLNILGAIAVARALGVDDATIVAALREAGRVPGRFEPVDEGQDFAVLVDYAHTPDSLENVLNAARELSEGRVIALFGTGGDRDRGKRPLMGGIAARLADRVVVTSDNPRSEDPDAILAEILTGIARSDGVHVQVDRRVAIADAIAMAQEGDVVVLAGKGHEQGQEFEGGRKVAFDDVAVAREALRARLDA